MSTRRLVVWEDEEQGTYSFRDKWTDRRRGRRDGRDRIPTYTAASASVEDGESITTPYHQRLADLGRAEMNTALEHFTKRQAAHEQRREQLRNQLSGDEQELARCRQELTRTQSPLTEEELRPRNPRERELAETGDLEGRRTRVRQNEIDAARRAVERAVSVVESRRRQLGDVDSAIDADFTQAQATARRCREYWQLRGNRYWAGVVATHAEGPSLSVLPAPAVDPPEWVTADGWRKAGLPEPGGMPDADGGGEAAPADEEV